MRISTKFAIFNSAENSVAIISSLKVIWPRTKKRFLLPTKISSFVDVLFGAGANVFVLFLRKDLEILSIVYFDLYNV